MVNNSSPIHMPVIKRNLFGTRVEDRTTLLLPALSSSVHYLGNFVPFIAGSDAAPAGAEFGIPAFADDGIVGGFVVGMRRKNGSVPLWDDALHAGTVTDATGELPVKYTFSATNDQASTTSASLELLEIMPIYNGDILEVSLFGASTASVARGTTVAAGTTLSTANMGVGLAVNVTYPFSLLESGGAKLLANKDFMTTLLDGNQPTNSNRVYVFPIRNLGSFKNVE